MPGDAQERPDVLRRRRIHQDRRTRAADQPEVAAEAGVLRQRFGARRAIAVAREKRSNQPLAAHAIRPRSIRPPRQHRPPAACSSQIAARAVNASCGRSAPSRSGHSTSTMPSRASSQPSSASPSGPVQPPQVEVMHRTDARVVALHQREGRARHLQRRVAARRAQECARESGLAGAQLALQQDRIPGPRQRGNRGGQSLRGREVGQLDRAGRGGSDMMAICPSYGVADNSALG